jgi:hypothetical protein
MNHKDGACGQTTETGDGCWKPLSEEQKKVKINKKAVV